MKKGLTIIEITIGPFKKPHAGDPFFTISSTSLYPTALALYSES